LRVRLGRQDGTLIFEFPFGRPKFAPFVPDSLFEIGPQFLSLGTNALRRLGFPKNPLILNHRNGELRHLLRA